jgi:multicomponent K+:H+ antiporter subunit E
MKRWLPAPLLALALAAMWLALAGSLSLTQLLLAALLGWLAPWLLGALRPERPRMKRPLTLLRLIGVVAIDALHSNGVVLRGLLRTRRRPLSSRFVRIPLELRDPTARACLCVITTAVPGTVWCETAPDGSALLLHVWDTRDEARFIADFKARYEQPLKERVECVPLCTGRLTPPCSATARPCCWRCGARCAAPPRTIAFWRWTSSPSLPRWRCWCWACAT